MDWKCPTCGKSLRLCCYGADCITCARTIHHHVVNCIPPVPDTPVVRDCPPESGQDRPV
jgi:hypothetical protein